MTDSFPLLPGRPACGAGSRRDIAEFVCERYVEAPQTRRKELLECLLRPVGPLALVAIANGAFAHLLYRLRGDAAPISLDQAAGITPGQVLELARYLEQCSPDVLRQAGSQIAEWIPC